MKTIIFILLLFTAILARSQTIDTAVKKSRASRCTPFKLNPLLDAVNVTHVGITNIYGNYTTSSPSIRVDYVFINDSELVISNGSLTLIGVDYLGWFNAVDKVFYFFGYIRTHVLDNTGQPFITYQ